MDFLSHLKSIEPLSFIGSLMVIVAAVYTADLFKSSYFSKVGREFLNLIKIHKMLIFWVLIIIVLEISFADFHLSSFCHNHFNPVLYLLLDLYGEIAEGWFLGGIIFMLILIVDYLNKNNLSIIFRISFTSLICSGILNTILKCVFNRERPAISMNPWYFFHFVQTGATDFRQLIYASNSMPSGHTIAVFASVTPLFLYTKNIVLRILLLSFAILIGLSRVYTLNHWLSDVTTGMALGILLGVAAYRVNKYRFCRPPYYLAKS